MQISTDLPRPALRTLETPEVATQGEYRLPCANDDVTRFGRMAHEYSSEREKRNPG